MSYEIIDFHMHPFINDADNLCMHKDVMRMDADTTYEEMKNAGISKFCGSVIKRDASSFEPFKQSNREALLLREKYNGDYVPGFHVSPLFIEDSIAEIDFAHENKVRLIGELVPYMHGWEDYSSEEFSHLLDEAAKHNMVVSLHSWDKYDNSMDNMLQHHRDIIVVGAHPGEYPDFMRHIERMKRFENYYLDISGLGPHRYGMLRRAIDEVGADRILFGSDFPTCSPATFIGSVLLDPLLTDSEKEQIFSQNAKRLLRFI